VFLPNLIQRAAAMDAQAFVGAFGKNEQVMRVCFCADAGDHRAGGDASTGSGHGTASDQDDHHFRD